MINSTSLITGASSELGYALAVHVLKQGGLGCPGGGLYPIRQGPNAAGVFPP